MKAFEVFAIYVTPFLIIGAAIKLLMKRYALDLSDVKNAGSKPRRRFSARSLAYRRIRMPLRMMLEGCGRLPPYRVSLYYLRRPPMRKEYSELVLLVPLFPIFLLGMLPLLLFPLLGFAGLTVIGALVIACGFGEYSRAMAEYNEDVIVRSYLARSDQDRHLSSLKSASRLAKGLIAVGVGIASSAIIGLYWN